MTELPSSSKVLLLSFFRCHHRLCYYLASCPVRPLLDVMDNSERDSTMTTQTLSLFIYPPPLVVSYRCLMSHFSVFCSAARKIKNKNGRVLETFI